MKHSNVQSIIANYIRKVRYNYFSLNPFATNRIICYNQFLKDINGVYL